MKTPVRARRAYLAGFGTSGSLVAGAALLFILGSAIVAFRGWPEIATGPVTTVVSAPRLAASTHVAKRLAAVLRGRAASDATGVATVPGRRPARRRASGSRRSVGSARTPGTVAGGTPASTASTASTAGSPGPASVGGCGSSCSQPQTVASGVTNTVAQGASNVGAGLGTKVSSTSGAVAGQLGGVTPQAANTVQAGGGTAGNAVSGTANTVANTVTQVGTALGGPGH